MLLKDVICSFAFIICLGAACQAHAITISGHEYDKFLEFQVADKFGYWVKEKKYYTVGTRFNHAVKVNDVTFQDAALGDFDIGYFYAMGTTTTGNRLTKDSPLRSGRLLLWDKELTRLLELTYRGAGQIDSTPIAGFEGQLNLIGLFDVANGTFADLGVISGPIYVALRYDRVTGLGRTDIHATNGTVTFYQKRDGDGTEIPEPATVALLATSLLGARRMRRKQLA